MPIGLNHRKTRTLEKERKKRTMTSTNENNHGENVMKKLLGLALLIAAPAWAATLESLPLSNDGSITTWLVAGPLPYIPTQNNPEHAIGFYVDALQSVGGEKNAIPAEGDRFEFEPGKAASWKATLTDPTGLLNFLGVIESTLMDQGVAYAFCELTADREKDAILKVGSNDGVRVWLNQDLVHDNHVARKIDEQGDPVSIHLKAGKNRLLAKVDQLGGAWELRIRVLDRDSKPIQGVEAAVLLQKSMQNRFHEITFTSTPLLLKTPEGERQLIHANIVSGGLTNVVCQVTSASWQQPVEMKLGDLPLGNHRIEIKIPPTDTPVSAILTSDNDRKEIDRLPIEIPKKMTIDLVQHVHTDIGYTRPQTEILPDHLRYIDYALDYCDLTDNYPDDARFRWTCEVSWTVREYLKRRPTAQIERLKRRVKEGRIEIAGMFLNMAEIADESSLAASLQPLQTIEEEYGFPVKTAMQNDVNGAAWCLVDYFSGIGIDYLTMGINKTRSLLPFDRPTCFWWESPSGKRVMVHRSDHYHTGNMWGIHTGDIEKFKTGILGYLSFLEENKYPFDRNAVKYSGYHTDNSPPATVECDLVKQWNETYAWPHLRIATAHEFLDYMKENHSSEMDVYRKAWPDWWTDGFGSAARETGEARNVHAAMQVNQTLLAMASFLGAELRPGVMDRANHVQEQLLFYDEHTYGAAESIDDPMAENSMVQWGEKSSYAWEAVKTAVMLREEALGFMQDLVPRMESSSIAVFNTLNWARSGLVEVFIDHEILHPDKGYRIVDGADGLEVPAQLLRTRSEGSYWALWVKDVPSLGYKILRIETKDEKKPVPVPTAVSSALENRFYSLSLDPKTGAITRLVDKETGRNYVDSERTWDLGQFIYETMPATNNAPASRDFREEAFKRATLRDVQIQSGANGAIWKSVIVGGNADGCAEKDGLRYEIRLYETDKRIEFHYAIRKKPITDPEAVYVAFPFFMPEAKVVYEAQGGIVQPGQDQIPRSSSDWQTVQNFISIRNGDGQLILVPDQVPLVQFGQINLGKWQESVKIERPHVYSWVMNNYWFTNFRASQEGEFKWDYALTTTNDSGNVAASHFGWGARVHLTGRVLPPMKEESRKGAKQQEAKFAQSILPGASQNLISIDAHPARYGKGIVLQLREVGGKESILDLSGEKEPIKKMVEVSVLEEELDKKTLRITFQPYETKFIKLVF